MFFERFRSAIVLLFITATLASALHALEHHNHAQEECQVCTLSEHNSALLPPGDGTPVLNIITFRQPFSPVTKHSTEDLPSRTRERAPPII